MARPLPVFGSLLQSDDMTEGPQHVRVFENGRFLYASFDYGREMMLDVRAHDRIDMLQYWLEWMNPAPKPPIPAGMATEVVERHERTPERPVQSAEEPPGEFITSIGTSKPQRRRMTLEEFLVA